MKKLLMCFVLVAMKILRTFAQDEGVESHSLQVQSKMIVFIAPCIEHAAGAETPKSNFAITRPHIVAETLFESGNENCYFTVHLPDKANAEYVPLTTNYCFLECPPLPEFMDWRCSRQDSFVSALLQPPSKL